jgi:excisionase family DNA binding protein
MNQLLYTMAEAQEITGLSRSTLYRLQRSGQLVTTTVGTRRLVTRQALERFVDQLSHEARESAGGLR